MSVVPSASTAIDRPSGGNIGDVVGLILDKGLVIDAYLRVSLIGIEVLTVDARVVVASVNTYLRFAERAGRLNLEQSRKPGLPELVQGVAGGVTGARAPAPHEGGPTMTGVIETADPRPGTAPVQAHPVYVYGVIASADAGNWPASRGVGGRAPVRTVAADGMAALVSDLPPDHTPGRPEDLDAHRRVLSEAIERTTVIPMRFGVVMDGDDVVRDRLLAQHASTLDEMLRRLDGHVQMAVKVFYADDELLRDVMAAHPELAQESAALAQQPDAAGAHAARMRLGEVLAGAVEARQAEVSSALLARLAPLAADVQVDPPGSERVALSAQLLVHRDRRADLDDEVHRLSEGLEGSLAFRYVGPLAPFSFSDLALQEDAASWG